MGPEQFPCGDVIAGHVLLCTPLLLRKRAATSNRKARPAVSHLNAPDFAWWVGFPVGLPVGFWQDTIAFGAEEAWHVRHSRWSGR